MILTTEALLCFVALGLYVFDSLVLLESNQGILLPRHRQRWDIHFGAHDFLLFGKEPWIPNPFTPHRPQFLISWSIDDSKTFNGFDLPLKIFLPATPLLWGIAFGLFVLLPIGFFTRVGDTALICALMFVYGCMATLLTWIWINRERLHLAKGKFARIVFESLVCPPFALNAVRRLSLAIPINNDLFAIGAKLLSESEWAACRHQIVKRLDSWILEEADNSESLTSLAKLRADLLKEDAQ